MATPLLRKLLPAAIAVCLAAIGLAAIADGAMRSKQLDTGLCQTTGGGRFVKIPGFRGERVDRRLLRDVRFLVRRYKIMITDGYSTDPVHSTKGEHPIGLALDIVPDTAAGGTWNDIDRLARWAEPRQDHPRAPFRWVGYDGDAGHGHGHHLHLSWSHSETDYDTPARTVYTLRCPTLSPKPPAGPGAEPTPPEEPGTAGGVGGSKSGRNDKGGKGKGDRGAKDSKKDGGGKGGGSGSGGGISPGDGSNSSGGVGLRTKHRLRAQSSASSVETAGVDAR